ncbi:hypothetical protein EG346_03100 [Chryseobacterium carnipullorum]|uniref:Uncharacterized protein n=2 Tax=Chryseobacterium carnipullorum TaxID=1124835 RepID=A0A3G6M310_CHRCU|nr:hypothetical protein EG346_03100 [Chryseobacterium carnipullorum]AZA66576.1 hypothetical protein EG345_19205 [Chryseobacterium carnipullorum]HBV14535.1 hypothetical protein [Chryseobacterium carnipullorum]
MIMKKIQYSTVGRNTFLTSLLSGTLLFISYVITEADFLLILGFYFVVIAAVVNLLVLLYELLEFLTDVTDKKSSGNSVLLLLLNIPITILYLLILFNYNM